MFTGIIEDLGKIVSLERQKDNLQLTVQSSFTAELKVDQSVAHNGICLTVVSIQDNTYTVTAIQETLKKTSMTHWKKGDLLNLERGMRLGDRLDGHIVQGHVDQIATCTDVQTNDGSWKFTFSYNHSLNNVTIEKGSITVNGVSLTVVDSKKNEFSVAVIPYTFEHTNFNTYKKNTVVNLEFDVIGKYVTRLMELRS